MGKDMGKGTVEYNVAILPIVTPPKRVLFRKAKAVDKVDDKVRQLLDDMVETMRAAPGQGLAAPQVGVAKRAIVLEVENHPLIQLVNPVLVSSGGGTKVEMEGCLSLPKLYAEVERHLQVTVTGLDRDGHPVTYEAEEDLARCFQHEIDHLDGILMLDRAINVYEEVEEDESVEDDFGDEAGEAGDPDEDLDPGE